MRLYTYFAADWDRDSAVVEKIREWEGDPNCRLSFLDAHDIQQSRDESLNCSIKRSLKNRLDQSHTFVIIVGDKTAGLRSGACYLCGSYNHYRGYCVRGYSATDESYIEYECKIAVEAAMRIIVIYNSTEVKRELCPSDVRYRGIHLPAVTPDGRYWNKEAIIQAIMGY